MGFWEEATDQAGRRYGDRFWRWFALAHFVRKTAPGLFGMLIVATVATLLYLAYRWLQPDWRGLGAALVDFAPTAGWWLLGAGALVGVAAVVMVLWRNHGWKLRYRWRWR